MKLKLTMMMGVPGSGKSTYAKRLKDDRTVIVCKDSIREMLGGEYVFSKELEPLVHELADHSIMQSLCYGFNVIIDETHITKERRMKVLDLVELMGVDVDVVWVATDKDVAYERRAKDPRGCSPELWKGVTDHHDAILEPIQYDEEELYNSVTIIRN